MIKRIMFSFFVLASLFASYDAVSAPVTRSSSRRKANAGEVSSEFRAGKASKVTATPYKSVRTTPVQTGEFKVDLVVITFPDCEQPESLTQVRDALSSLSGGFTIADYDLPSALLAAAIIAAVTFVICMGGLYIGRKAGTKLAGKAGILGGSILIFIGLEIFITSWF